MSASQTFDYILVGQGLAGSCLSLQLLKRRKKILVIDQFNKHAATQVAAGLFNPITGRKMIRTWKADELFPYLHDFYQEAEQITAQKFFYPMPLYRPFLSIEEQNEWMGKSADESLVSYIHAIHTTPIAENYVNNVFGGVRIKQSGYLNTQVFSSAVRDYIRAHATLLETKFEEQNLIIRAGEVRYLEYTAKKIVFCQGVDIGLGKFSWLPVRPLKGETLKIKTTADISEIYNRGVYVVPGIWKVGATYNTTDRTEATTESARQELEEKLKDLVCFPYQIIGQEWGMRPTTPDRKPILGPHPDHPEMVIFNGLGTKGVSLAPFFSMVLTEWLENNRPINKEVDIDRYKHYNYGGNILK